MQISKNTAIGAVIVLLVWYIDSGSVVKAAIVGVVYNLLDHWA